MPGDAEEARHLEPMRGVKKDFPRLTPERRNADLVFFASFDRAQDIFCARYSRPSLALVPRQGLSELRSKKGGVPRLPLLVIS
jgi:hypothetical protein